LLNIHALQRMYRLQTCADPLLRKRALLVHLIRSGDMRQVLVFVRMKRDANRLARQLVQDGVTAKEIHSDRTQAERMQALEDFKQGKVPVLVATDIAARGLDIEELPFVVNYELPHTPEDYVHRIGRTGRAGLPGEAISLVSPDEMKYLEDIERMLKRKLPRASAPELARETRPGHRPKGGRHERPAERPQARPHAAPRPAAPAFDYTKPYEPAPSGTPARPEHARPGHRRPERPTAALLGGRPAKREPHKS
jgi:superfamily II DNA/RNA helicase